MPRIRAIRELDQVALHGASSQRQVYELTWAATGDKDLADKTAAKWLQRQLEAGVKNPRTGWED